MNKYIVFTITLFFGYFSFAQTLEIPVVFHIVSHPSKDITQIKEIDFENIIDSINRRINQVKIGSIVPDFQKDVGYPNLIFKLAKKNEFCKPIEAITFHSIRYPKTGLNNYDLKILKKKGYYNKEKYFNIWFVNVSDSEKENAGYYSSTLDGIIIDIDELSYIGVKEKDPFLLIHEIGHYLGLKHIWGKDITNSFPFYDGCDFDDGIDDTPSQEKPHIRKQFTTVQDSCEGVGKTNHQNFMDYSYDTGMFTKEQVEVMREYIKSKRPGLLWKSNCENEEELIIGQFQDNRDNQLYKWVQIGNQKWMTQNLNYSTPNSSYYDNKIANGSVYGRLYNWNDAQIVCPKGWRLPSKADWDELVSVIGNDQTQIRSQYGWGDKNNGTNSSGLNIYPSGEGFYLGYKVKFEGLGKKAKFWLSDSNVFGYSREIGGMYGFTTIPKAGSNNKKDKLSCRCIEGGKIQKQNNSSIKTTLGKGIFTYDFKIFNNYHFIFTNKSSREIIRKGGQKKKTFELPEGKYNLEITDFGSKRKRINDITIKNGTPYILNIIPFSNIYEKQPKKKKGNTLNRLLNTPSNTNQYYKKKN